jgi:hypothetical protein
VFGRADTYSALLSTYGEQITIFLWLGILEICLVLYLRGVNVNVNANASKDNDAWLEGKKRGAWKKKLDRIEQRSLEVEFRFFLLLRLVNVS